MSTNDEGLDILTGKLFEYFYSQKPVFAIERYESELDVILKKYQNYYLAYELEENSVKEVIHRMHDDWKQGRLSHSPNHSFIEMFNRESLTGELAEVFDKLLEAKQ